MALADKLKKLRIENNLTQDELAEKLYVTRTAISKWETGKGYPSIDSLKQLAILFDISIDELISEEDIEHKNNLEQKDSKSEHMIALVGLIIAIVFIVLTFINKGSFFKGICIGVVILGACIYLVFTKLSLVYYIEKQITKKQMIFNKLRELLAAIILFLIIYYSLKRF